MSLNKNDIVIGNFLDDLAVVLTVDHNKYDASNNSTKQSTSDTVTPLAKTSGALYNQVRYLSDLLTNAGFPNTLVKTYAIAQVMFETAGLSSPLAQKYNNFSGIKYIGKSYQKNATNTGNGYAAYATPQDWANDYKRVLSLAPGRPINATSAQEFLNGLIANHYFGADPATYSAGLNAWLKKINAAITQANGTWASIQKGNTYVTVDDQGNTTTSPVQTDKSVIWQQMKAAWVGLPTTAKVVGGLAALFVAVKIFED